MAEIKKKIYRAIYNGSNAEGETKKEKEANKP